LRRDFGERWLANWFQEMMMKLNLLVVLVALALATVAGQSAFI